MLSTFYRLLGLLTPERITRRRVRASASTVAALVEELESRKMLSAITINTNPVSQSINAGETVTFTATASGTPTPSLQWQISTDGGTTFTDIAGATSTPYSFNVTPSQNGYEFRAEFTNSSGTVTTQAATLTVLPILVTTLTDENNGTVDPSFGTGTSLREAINFADSQNGPQTIQFAAGLTGSILLTMGELPVITGNVTIDGPGAPNLTINGQGTSRVFEVASGATADLIGLTIANGNGTGANSGDLVNGGGILNAGTLTIEESSLSANTNSGNPNQGSGYGGAIDNTGTLTVISSTFASNNVLSGDGGGIANFGTLSVTNSTFSSNVAGSGGAIENFGTATVTDTTVYNNTVVGASSLGAGILNQGGSLLLNNTIVDSLNSVGTGAVLNAASSHNLFVNGGNGVPTNGVNGNIVVASSGALNLGTLANNGGPTTTVAELAGSPAIGAGLANGVLTDERGYTRHSTPDIGAFELVPTGTLVIVTNPVSQSVNAGHTVSFTAGASSNPIATVQWQVSTDLGASFSNIIGATSTTYSFTATLGQSSDEYRAVFTNSSTNATATTQAATLTVTPVSAAPVITLNPTSQSLVVGQTVTFAGAASGTPTPTVQWQLSTDGGVTFANITGATSTTYSFTASLAQNGDEYRAVFTNTQGTATTSAATLSNSSLLAPPVVTLNPLTQSINAGLPVSFTVAASGSPTPTVQWQVSTDGGLTYANISGATSTTYSFTATGVQDGFEYRAIFTNLEGTATTAAAFLFVQTAAVSPVVTLNPTSQSVPQGNTVTFTVAGTGNPAPTVQWQMSTDNGATFTNITGATSTSYSFTSAASQNGYEYRAVFTNAIGTATTTAAILTILPPSNLPVITLNPTSTTIVTGQTVIFTALATGSPFPTVQWQVSTDLGQSFNNIPGAISRQYSFTATLSQSSNEYRAVFTNSNGSTYTTVATLIVTPPAPPLAAPVITLDPISEFVFPNARVTFAALASGNPTPTVQWQVSTDFGAFVNIPGATSTTLTITAPTSASIFEYRAVFTNSQGTATTAAAFLEIQIPTAVPVVTTDPSNLTVNAGQTATFTAAATGGPIPTVQWQVSTDGTTFTNIPGATSTTLSFVATVAENGYKYQAVFTNGTGTTNTVTTKVATLTVLGAPVVITNPTSQTIIAGQSVTFTAAGAGNPTPTVQWQISTDGGATFTAISGATTAAYTFTVAAGQNGYEYQAVFTNSAGVATTSAATLTIGVAPVVTINPLNQSVNAGQTVTFTAAASGIPVPTVQWQVGSGTTFTNIPGATSLTYSFVAQATQNGLQYQAVFTNSQGAATTTAATLTVFSAPVITTNPTNQVVGVGQTATFTAAAAGNPTPTVQWQVSVNGQAFTNITGATSATYSFTVANGQNGSIYQAVFTNSAGSATTIPAILTTVAAPFITLNPVDQSVIVGQTVIFTAAASGLPTPTVQWQISIDGGNSFANISGAIASNYSFVATSNLNGDIYRAVFLNASGAAVTLNATLTVSSAASGLAVTGNPLSQTVTAGKTVTFTAAAGTSSSTGHVATASSVPAATVQWQISTNGGASFTNVAGATSATLNFTTTATQNGDKFRAVFTNSKGFVTTTAATLTVASSGIPVVTTNPTNQSAIAGHTVTFTAAASGNPAPTVQWQISTNGGTTYTNISGATSTTLNFTTTATQNGDRFRAVFTNSLGKVTTTAATLTVTVATAPVVTTNPTNQSAIAGHTVTFTAAASGNPAPTVQWQISTNGGTTYTNISGATSATLNFTTTLAQNGAKFRAVFTNAQGTITTTAATLTVTAPVAPTITTNPTSQTATAGHTVTFTAAASGNPTPTVQWQISTDGGKTFTNVSGATSPTLNFTTTAAENGDKFRAVFTNPQGTATTAVVTLTVH